MDCLLIVRWLCHRIAWKLSRIPNFQILLTNLIILAAMEKYRLTTAEVHAQPTTSVAASSRASSSRDGSEGGRSKSSTLLVVSSESGSAAGSQVSVFSVPTETALLLLHKNNAELCEDTQVTITDGSDDNLLSEVSKVSIGVQAEETELQKKSGLRSARRLFPPLRFQNLRQWSVINASSEGASTSGEPLSDKGTSKSTNEKNKKVLSRQVSLVMHKLQSEQQTDSLQHLTECDGTTEDIEVNCQVDVVERQEQPEPEDLRCKICKKTFTLRANLKVHNWVHHIGAKPFACNVCGEGFRTKECVQRHMEEHPGVKPFSCNSCKRRFSSQDHKALHDLHRHEHGNFTAFFIIFIIFYICMMLKFIF